MQKAQGLVVCNKDRLKSSRRLRDKNLQLQLKLTKQREIETTDFHPVQNYYVKLPGDQRQTEEIGVVSRKCSFIIKLRSPEKCKTEGKEIEERSKLN